jgi:hypothetical protein
MKFRLTLLACLISFLSVAQLQSPDEFLGYPFTYHYQLLEYCKYVASQRPALAKWISYVKTNENRELGILILTKSN